MRLLADENFPRPVVAALMDAGHDVYSVAESLPGASDEAVLDRARTDGRVLLTLDKDFGELAFRQGLPAESGVVLFRLSGASPDEDNRRAIAALQQREEWASFFSVITDTLVRIRPIPRKQPDPP
jgi:predicted nuclease of predicted toxin-antitoxin system